MWEAQKVEQLKGFWSEGLSYQEIAQRFGVTKSIVAGVVRRLREKGVDFPKREAWGEAVWTPEQDEILIRGKEEGLSNEEIGEAVGKSKAAVWARANRLGVTLPASEQVKRRRRRARPKLRLVEKPNGEAPIFARSAPSPFKTCQWIPDGVEPSADDSCKCGVPTVRGFPYCEEHARRAFIRDERWRDRATSPSLKEPRLQW